MNKKNMTPLIAKLELLRKLRRIQKRKEEKSINNFIMLQNYYSSGSNGNEV